MKSYRNIVTLAVAWGSFWVVAPFINREYLFAFVNALVVSVAVGVIIAYSSGVKEEMFRGDLSAGHYLIFGILCTWGALACRQLWSWIWRYAGRPEWMNDHLFFAFFVWIAFTGGVLHLTARGAIDGKVPSENWIYVGGVVAVAVVLTFLGVILFDP